MVSKREKGLEEFIYKMQDLLIQQDELYYEGNILRMMLIGLVLLVGMAIGAIIPW